MNLSGCVFCDLPGDREIASYAGFRLVWCIGPITRGHVVLVPDVHVAGLLDLPEQRVLEFDQCRQEIRRLWKDRYGGCIMIEHGRHGGNGRNYHSHAHLHVIPLSVSIRDEIVSQVGNPLEGSYYERCGLVAGEYLFLADEQGPDIFLVLRRKPQRMFFRRLLADRLGIPARQLDWRVFPRWEIVVETQSDVLAILADTPNSFVIAAARGARDMI